MSLMHARCARREAHCDMCSNVSLAVELSHVDPVQHERSHEAAFRGDVGAREDEGADQQRATDCER